MLPENFSPSSYWRAAYATHNATGRAVGIPALGARFNDWMHRARGDSFVRAANALPCPWPAARVLDLGAGVGVIVRAWQSLGVRDIVAADLNDAAVAHIQQTFPDVVAIQFELGGDQPLPVDGEFDAVSAIDVLFHIIDDDRYRKAIATIAAAVQPGGVVLLSEGLLDQREASAPCLWRSGAEILSLLEDAGLRITAVTPLVPVLSWPVAWPRALRPWWHSMRIVSALGPVALAAVYAVDRVLARIARAGPATKLVVCTWRSE